MDEESSSSLFAREPMGFPAPSFEGSGLASSRFSADSAEGVPEAAAAGAAAARLSVFVEASLIALLAGNESWRPYNVNWETNDRGGAGPRQQEWENARYLLYLAFGFALGVQLP